MKKIFGLDLDSRENNKRIFIRYDDKTETKLTVESLAEHIKVDVENNLKKKDIESLYNKEIKKMKKQINTSPFLNDEEKTASILQLETKEAKKSIEQKCKTKLVSQRSIELSEKELDKIIKEILSIFERI